MQPVSRLAPARAGTPCQQLARATTTTTSRPCRRVAPARRLRASCGGRAMEPVVGAREGDQEDEAEAGLAPEELEVLEEVAIAGVDEGRRPTDYDRRAHMFEESSRVFRELKHQRDGHGGSGRAGAATAAETATREQQQQLG